MNVVVVNSVAVIMQHVITLMAALCVSVTLASCLMVTIDVWVSTCTLYDFTPFYSNMYT